MTQAIKQTTYKSDNDIIRLFCEAKEIASGTSLRIPTRAHLQAALDSAAFWKTCADDFMEENQRLGLANESLQKLYDLRAAAADEFAETVCGRLSSGD